MSLTYAIAMSAAQDAANRQMRAAGRSAWNADDYALACRLVRILLAA